MVTLKLKFGRRNAAARVLPWLQFLLLGIYPCTCSLVPTPGSLAPGSRVAIVRSPQELQDAARDGVPHIVVVEHLDMSGAPTVARLDGLQSLNSALIRVRRGTVSIVVRLSSDTCIGCGCRFYRMSCLRLCGCRMHAYAWILPFPLECI